MRTKTMHAILWALVACVGVTLALPGAAKAQSKLPLPDPEFKGKIGATYKDSKADTGMFKSPSAPEGAPNILLVLIDDAGFGATDTFGGPCHTPTLTKLAENGLRYNRFHTTSLCSPTRAALLTGHNHHSAATGQIMELATGFPGYTGIIPQTTASIGRILQENGYSTAWIGKNHNVPDFMVNNVGPFSRWPNAMGFDYFYGFLGGEMDQWYPALFENQNVVKNLPTPEEGYNLQVDQTDKAINWMRSQNSIAPDRPFFLYYATGATHAPHHVPQEWVEKYKGKFAHGFDKQREITFKRQKELGVIPQDAKLTPRMKQVPGWDSYDEDTHKVFERQMETYAGYYEYADDQIGRIVDCDRRNRRARQHLDHLHRWRQRWQRRRRIHWHRERVAGSQRDPCHDREQQEVYRPVGLTRDIAALWRGLGLGDGHAISVDQADGVLPGRHSQSDGGFLAGKDQGQGRFAQPVSPRQ